MGKRTIYKGHQETWACWTSGKKSMAGPLYPLIDGLALGSLVCLESLQHLSWIKGKWFHIYFLCWLVQKPKTLMVLCILFVGNERNYVFMVKPSWREKGSYVIPTGTLTWMFTFGPGCISVLYRGFPYLEREESHGNIRLVYWCWKGNVYYPGMKALALSLVSLPLSQVYFLFLLRAAFIPAFQLFPLSRYIHLLAFPCRPKLVHPELAFRPVKEGWRGGQNPVKESKYQLRCAVFTSHLTYLFESCVSSASSLPDFSGTIYPFL